MSTSGEETTTAQEFLHHQALIEKASDSPCTWPMSTRQRLYTCSACPTMALCMPCAINCHQHETNDLFFRSGFKCDCDCSEKNNDNSFDDAFRGIYCYCRLEQGDEDMFQCLGCEDWFHRSCLDCIPDSFEEFLCKDCVKENEFLIAYQDNPGFEFSLVGNNSKQRKRVGSVDVETTSCRGIVIANPQSNTPNLTLNITCT